MSKLVFVHSHSLVVAGFMVWWWCVCVCVHEGVCLSVSLPLSVTPSTGPVRPNSQKLNREALCVCSTEDTLLTVIEGALAVCTQTQRHTDSDTHTHAHIHTQGVGGWEAGVLVLSKHGYPSMVCHFAVMLHRSCWIWMGVVKIHSLLMCPFTCLPPFEPKGRGRHSEV